MNTLHFKSFVKPLALVLFFAVASLLGGCADITGRGPAHLDNTVDAAQRQTHARVGYVYCMRGWLGIFSEGMDTLAHKIDTKLGIPAVSVADEEWTRLKEWIVAERSKGEIEEGPLVLLGHSWGADDMIRVASYLQEKNITVDLLVLIDPVTPPVVPTNVKRVYCVYYSHPLTDWYPFWRGVPAAVKDSDKTELTNIDLRTAKVDFDTSVIVHPTIDKVEGVHNLVMKEIEKTCPQRATWLQTHHAAATPTPVTVGLPLSKPQVATP